MDYTEALERLSNLVMQRNGLTGGNVHLTFGIPQEEKQIDWDELMKVIDEDQERRRQEDEARLEEYEQKAMGIYEDSLEILG